MKLYSFPPSPNHRKVAATAAQLGLEPELVMTDLTKGDQRKPEFVAMNPNTMIPTLKDGDFCLWESSAIMIYLCSKKPGNTLFPSDPQMQADVLRWMFWQSNHFGQACRTLTYEHLVKKLFEGADPDPAEVARGLEMFRKYAKILNDHLSGKEWIVGNHLTLADFAIGAALTYHQMAQMPLSEFPILAAWYARLETLEAWKKSAPPMLAGV